MFDLQAIGFALKPGDDGDLGGAGQSTSDWIHNYITTPLMLIGAGLVVLALVIVGIKIILKAGANDQGGSGLREAVSSVAKVLIGGLIIGGAGAIGSLIITIGNAFSAN